MGYTHYNRNLSFTDVSWEKLRKDVRKLLKNLPEGLKVQREYDNDSRPLIGKDAIVFNGVGEDGHETFWLDKNETAFSFCNTARKPYDLAVCCVLMLISAHATSGKISSDGINAAWSHERTGNSYPGNVDQEWKDAWKHFHSIFPKIDKEKAFKLFHNKEMICRLIDA